MAGKHDEPLHRPTRAELDAAFRFYERVTSDLVAIFDRKGCILFVNPVAERLLGCAPADCLGRQMFDFLHPDDRTAARAAFDAWAQAPVETSFVVATRVVARDGKTRRLDWTVVPHRDAGNGTVSCFISHARDVTPQFEAAERVQRSEVRQHALLHGMLDPVVTIDIHGRVVEAGGGVGELFGWRPEELIGRNINVLMVEPYASEHDGYLANYRRTGHTSILGRTRQFEVRKKDGTPFLCELSVSRVDIPGEPEPLFVGSFRDVSARVRAEQALAESEARMRAIFDQELQFVGLLALDGRVLEVNESALRGIDARREDVIGRPFAETAWWRAPGSAERVRAAVAAAAGGELVRFEVGHVDRQGRQRWIDFSLKPVRDAAGAVQFLLPEGRDITRIKEVHARELAMNDALAQIGESASVLAHEIKNPLTAVNLALRAVADKLGEDQKSVLEDLAMRLAKLERTMRRTLSFARPLRLEREHCDVRSLFDFVARSLEPELGAAHIALEVLCPASLPALFADRGLLEEVLLNLVRNAREALEHGGKVRIAAERDGKSHLCLRVEDDGPGIAPAVRAELFKPFVTNKQGGTGLGLAIARKIVIEHGGEIGVQDGALGGACFWIRLPAADARYPGVRRQGAASA